MPGRALDSQLWFFLYEDVDTSSYKQSDFTFAEVKEMGLTLPKCLTLTGIKGRREDFQFWMFSAGIRCASQLQTDESIIGTYNMYCSKDPIIQIIIRRKRGPSPNSSRAPSHAASLASRQEVSSRRGFSASEVSIQPETRDLPGSIDIASFEPIKSNQQMISIVKNGETLTFTPDLLRGINKMHLNPIINESVADLHVGCVETAIAMHRPLTDIVAETIGPDGVARKAKLDADIWRTYIIRGDNRDWFKNAWDVFVRTQAKREELLGELAAANPNFEKKCMDFICDLKRFGLDKKARKRLEGTNNQYYLGRPYFNKRTRDTLLQLPLQTGLLKQALDALMSDQAGSTTLICSSQQLSPIFESALGINWDKGKKTASVIPGRLSRFRLKFRAKGIRQKRGRALYNE